MSDAAGRPPWWARGLLFENCTCQVICPGHIHFSQLCTHERCKGYWALRIDAGAFGEIDLAGVKALVVFDSPRHMIDGGWTERVLVDAGATEAQRQAILLILTGGAGGPWELLARFVSTRLEARVAPIVIEDAPETKRATIRGLLDAVVTNITGRDRSRPVRFENIFNQIHASSQVLATGTTHYDDGVIVVSTDRTHGLHSEFEWNVV